MKIKRECFALLVGIFLMIFLSGGVAASDDCAVVPRANCLSNQGNYIVAGLSAETNAHAEKSTSGSYNYVLCCNFDGSTTCSGTNKVFGISSDTNAHVSIPSGTGAYASSVCYGDLVCRKETAARCSSDYPLRTISISAETNAHAARDDLYGTKICCKHATVPVPGTVYWADSANQQITTEVVEGTIVRLFFNTDKVSVGDVINYEIKEEDTLTPDDLIKTDSYTVTAADVTQGFAYDVWETAWQCDGEDPIFGVCTAGDPEYYFNAVILGQTIRSELPDLSVSENVPDTLYCDSSVPEWVYPDGTHENSMQNCELDGITATCCSIGFTCNSDGICEEDGEAGIDQCEDYDGPVGCNLDPEGVNETSIRQKYNNHYCEEGNNFISNTRYITNCRCEWDTLSEGEKCYAKADENILLEDGTSVNIGTCAFDEDTTDTCADGFLDVSWTAIFEWNTANVAYTVIPSNENAADYVLVASDGKYHYDPDRASESCIDGERTVPCRNPLELPFFGMINILVTLLALAAIYGFVALRKPKK